jgi:hypothetical protein
VTTFGGRKRTLPFWSLAVGIGLAVAFGVSGALLALPSAAAAPIVPASGGSQQWAFGGSAGASFSCSGSACGAGSTITQLSLFYYVAWVVIYTATNVSSTQTQFEVQAAVNASVTVSFSACESTGSGPCSQESVQASFSGREIATGFTNVSNAGSVYLNAGPGSPGSVAAYAVMNAQSNAQFNFSGAATVTLPVNGSSETGNLNLDLGGNAATTVSFASPLGIVPLSPQSGQSWNSSAPYSATGAYTSGYSLSANLGGHSENENHWNSLSVSPSGTLDVNGSDLGSATLYDNYTNPPTATDVQIIALSFSNGEFAGTDGWLLLPSGLYGGATGALSSGFGLVGTEPTDSTAVGGSESAYFHSGTGFVGVQEAANATALGLGSTGPNLNLQAGPEPVSVAQQQYSGITSSGSSSSFPWIWAIVGVVVVVVVVVVACVALVMARRSRRPPMMAPPAAQMAPPAPPPPMPPTQ